MNTPSHGALAILVMKAQRGDMDAFSELYALTYQKLYNYACHYLRDSSLAQDAIQEAYILALKNINKLNDPLLFTAWLNQIIFRVCYDLSKKRNNDYGIVDMEFLDSFRDENISFNPEAHTESQDELARLRKAIDELPYLQKSVITLRFFNDMKLSEIAEAMDISLSSVKRYLETAKETLASVLSS